MMAEETEQAEAAVEKKSGKGLIIILIFLVLLLIAVGGGAAWMFMQQKSEDPDELAVPHFMQMEPFIISLKSENRPHYLQIKLSLMSRDPEALKQLETYRPMIRNEIIRYLNTLKYMDVLKPEAPDAIRTETISRVNDLLVKEQVEVTMDDLIITDLVIQ
ncbi:flagellar basal body-associated FliL family protein [Endozoicomonas acroporae]|uniref:flagellar basal body-associated FliL family protein n=1 Tax=Endozoicomonas acroporae TaxID=1701104 RepID=UPI000C76C431|nr:flagellar basal body-associated FliL family protein [Endozoicomonas acroporae]